MSVPRSFRGVAAAALALIVSGAGVQGCGLFRGEVIVKFLFGGQPCGGPVPNQPAGVNNVRSFNWSLVDVDLGGLRRGGADDVQCKVGDQFTISGLESGNYVIAISAKNSIGTTCWDNTNVTRATFNGQLYTCDGASDCRLSPSSNCNCPFEHRQKVTNVNFDISPINATCANSGS